ncbi:MAG: hypothetical protein A2X45_25145 [Lentisphaerae bacterium GWF2_50_93]|nr:MAG: hypothetical protein A2X45_25145 [Lentisphaerae bacterium GWF2_50_93]
MKEKQAFTDKAKLKIVLVGDSTVTGEGGGWGDGFRMRVNPGVEVINLARGGRSSGSFVAEGRWKQALELKPDYVTIQFGHNDQPGHGPGRESDPETSYRENMLRYVNDAIAAGIKPVLVTPLSRRQWGEDGRIRSSLQPYADVVQRIAKEKNVLLVDLHKRSIDVYNSLGRDGTKLISPKKGEDGWDGTHLNLAGGDLFGAIIADEFREIAPELGAQMTYWREKKTNIKVEVPSLPPNEFAANANKQPPSPMPQGSRTITVAADGSGDYRTVQEAVAAAPANNSDRTTIRIKPGTYYGCIVVPRSRPNLSFIGENPDTTILTYALNVYDPIPADVPPRMNGNGVIVLGDGFLAENLSFRNTAGERGQAMALRVQADRCVFRNCKLYGWQDTLLASSKRQYFDNCYIEGRVDFIYGGSTAVFENCIIHSKNGGYVTAASTPEDQKYGFVFLNCKLTGNIPAYLGRPWRPFAYVAYVNCEMGDHIRPEGWNNWGKESNEKTARYMECNNSGPGANTDKRVPWMKKLDPTEAKNFTADAVLGGNDGWKPKEEK